MQETFSNLKQNCPKALATIHTAYKRRLFWWGKQWLKDDFVLENLVQEAFLKLWLYRHNIQRPEHIFWFLRFVLKRDCITHYHNKSHAFHRNARSLESFGNYQDYMLGHDPLLETEHLALQEKDQERFEKLQSALPLLDSESRRLLELCLTHGFQYKNLATAMGTSVTGVSIKMKSAVSALKTMLHHGEKLENLQAHKNGERPEPSPLAHEVMSRRCADRQSFAEIAAALNIPVKEVHGIFVAAYNDHNSATTGPTHFA